MAMVRSVNRVWLTGRIGSIYGRNKLPDNRPGPLNISMVTQEIYRGGKQRTDWHKVAFWGVNADFIEKYLKVGALVAIEGSLRTVQKKNSDGSLSHFVNIDGFQLVLLVDSPKSKDPAEEEEGRGEGPGDDAEPEDTSGREEEPDDVPF